MRQPHTPPPVDPAGLPTVTLLLHTAVPAATDHPYRNHASPAGTARHLIRQPHLDLDLDLDLDGEHAELFTGAEQLHRFAHKSTQERVILAALMEPFVGQILDLLGPLPSDLHPIVLAEAALATQLLDAPIHWPALDQHRSSDPPPASGPK